MNYRPNYNAQRLAGRSGQVIGILIETRAPAVHFRTLGSIENIAALHGYRCMIGEFGKDPQLQKEQYDTFIQHGVDGVICMPSDYLSDAPEFTRRFADTLHNTVFIDTPAIPGAAYIHVDRYSVVAELVEHLYAQEARRIAQVRGDVPYRTSLERLAGYREGMRRCGFTDAEMNVLEIPPHFTAEGTLADCEMLIRKHILPEKIDALLMPNDLYAISMLNKLREAGLRTPEEVMVAGYDDNDYSLCTVPGLTTVNDKTEEQARLIVELLFRKLRSADEEIRDENGVVRPELVVRGSTLKHS